MGYEGIGLQTASRVGFHAPFGACGMVKILIVTGDAGEAQEIYYAKFRLEEEGWQVQIAAPEKRAFLSVVHDFEPGFDTYTEKPGYRVTADLALDEVVPRSYQGSFSRAAGRPSICETGPRRSRSCAISWKPRSRSRPIATVRSCFWRPAGSRG